MFGGCFCYARDGSFGREQKPEVTDSKSPRNRMFSPLYQRNRKKSAFAPNFKQADPISFVPGNCGRRHQVLRSGKSREQKALFGKELPEIAPRLPAPPARSRESRKPPQATSAEMTFRLKYLWPKSLIRDACHEQPQDVLDGNHSVIDQMLNFDGNQPIQNLSHRGTMSGVLKQHFLDQPT
jgi:hypothetical protein